MKTFLVPDHGTETVVNARFGCTHFSHNKIEVVVKWITWCCQWSHLLHKSVNSAKVMLSQFEVAEV